MAAQKQDDQHERTFSSYVRIRDVVLKTYLGRWTIGRSGERGSGISVLPARYDDDYEYMCFNQAGNISTREGTSLKLVDKFTYLGSSVLSTEKDKHAANKVMDSYQ